MIVAICLLLLVILGVFSVILGGTWTGMVSNTLIDIDLITNGTSTTLEFGGQDWLFNIDPIAGAIGWFVVIASVVAIVGVRVVGTGLADSSARIISLVIIYSSLWTLLSIPAYPLIVSIEVFGALIYVGLTIAYAVGIIQNFDMESS